jgi:hypothetical protein
MKQILMALPLSLKETPLGVFSSSQLFSTGGY